MREAGPPVGKGPEPFSESERAAAGGSFAAVHEVGDVSHSPTTVSALSALAVLAWRRSRASVERERTMGYGARRSLTVSVGLPSRRDTSDTAPLVSSKSVSVEFDRRDAQKLGFRRLSAGSREATTHSGRCTVALHTDSLARAKSIRACSVRLCKRAAAFSDGSSW